MPDYCRNHRSHFCPCVKAYLYEPPFVLPKDVEPIEVVEEKWDAAEKRHQENNLERWPILRNPPSG